MMKSVVALIVFSAFGNFSTSAFGSDNAALDPAYRHLSHPRVDDQNKMGRDADDKLTPPASSDTEAMIDAITPVRDQGARGDCSIFSATAMLEAMLVLKGHANSTIDLSEEWLEYLVMRASGSEGSESNINFATLSKYGDTDESLLPYVGETWDSANYSSQSQERCGKLSGSNLTKCLLGHYNPAYLTESDSKLQSEDPGFLAARTRATEFLSKELAAGADSAYDVGSTTQVKQLLASGIPVTLDITFYFGAWNHRLAVNHGMTRNMDHWNKGVVFYPEQGSVDLARSPEEPDGHSILIVGYDDNVEVTKDVQMTDGTTKSFTHKGVYYFKNSWGTDSFGVNFQLNGKSHPGYGMMVQDYANQFGSFYQFPVH